MQAFQTEHHADPATNRMQERLRAVLGSIINIPILNGRLVEDVVIGASDTPVSHGLGRVPRGCFMVKGNAVIVWSGTQQADGRLVYLTSASGTKTVSLWVF